MLVLAKADLPIRRVDACSHNIDNDFARTSHRIGKLAVRKHVRSAVPFNESCLHLSLMPRTEPEPHLPLKCTQRQGCWRATMRVLVRAQCWAWHRGLFSRDFRIDDWRDDAIHMILVAQQTVLARH